MSRRPPLHPILFAIYPVLFLYGQNIEEVTLGDLAGPLAIVLAAGIALYAVARLVLQTSGRAALAASLLLVVFFAYGRVLTAVAGSPIGGGRLLLVAAAVVGLGLAAIVLVKRDPARLNRGLDLLGTVLTVVAVVGIVSAEVPRALNPAGPPASNQVTATTKTTRDIYYIVIEDMGSPKVLQDHFGLTDPHAFDWLTELGFQVPAQSATNYGKSILMLASTMNMEYLDGLAATVGTESSDYHPIYRIVDDNAAARFLKAQGYRYVHIGSWWDPTEKSSIADINYGIASPSDFTEALLKTTLLPEITSRLPRVGIHLPAQVELSGDGAQYDGAVLGFQKLAELPAMSGPKFVFAHILVPHKPYVFTAEGKRLSPDARSDLTREQAFLGQTLYVNRRLEEVTRALLAGPEATRPIVIIQTDEGPNPPAFDDDAESFSWLTATQTQLEIKYPILNAFYLPRAAGEAPVTIDPRMSTVNTFRLLFSTYFGADLPLLPDRLFIYRDKAHPYAYTDITDRILH